MEYIEENKDLQDAAVMLAFQNIINCLKYRNKAFTDVSIANFKTANPNEAGLLRHLWGNVKTREEWFTNLHGYLQTTLNDELGRIGEQAFASIDANKGQTKESLIGQDNQIHTLPHIQISPKQIAPELRQTELVQLQAKLQELEIPQQHEDFQLPTMNSPQQRVFYRPQKYGVQQQRIESIYGQNIPVCSKSVMNQQRPNAIHFNNREAPSTSADRYRYHNEEEEGDVNQTVYPYKQNTDRGQHQVVDLVQLKMLETLERFANKIVEQTPVSMENKLKRSKQNVIEWFEEFDRQTTRWTYESKGKEVIRWISETALRRWQMMSEESKYEYNHIKKYLCDNLGPSDRAFKVKQDFYTAQQEPSETVEQFAQRLCSFEKLWPPNQKGIFEADLINAFKRNCNPEIAIAITNVRTNSFEDLLKQAMKVSECLNRLNQDVYMEAEISADTICYSCDQKGHIARYCPRKRTSNTTNSQRKPTQNSQQMKYCVICGGDNHYATDCFKWREMLGQIPVQPQTRLTLPGLPTTGQISNRPQRAQRNEGGMWCTECRMSNHNTA